MHEGSISLEWFPEQSSYVPCNLQSWQNVSGHRCKLNYYCSHTHVGVFVYPTPLYNVGFDMHFTKLSPNQFINCQRWTRGGELKIAVFARMYWARQVFLFLRALSTIIFARIVALMPAIYRQLNNIPPILESTIVSSQSRILYRSLGLLNLEPRVIIGVGGIHQHVNSNVLPRPVWISRRKFIYIICP
jgi:hypothetical protein